MRLQHHAGKATTAPSLMAWGISADADLIYQCLVRVGALSAEDLRRALGLSGQRVAAALDELVAARAVRARPGRSDAAWAAAPLSDVMVAAPQSRARRESVPRDSDPYAVIQRLLPGSVPLGDGLRHLPTRALARRRMAELVDVVGREHMAMSPERAYDAESARAAVPMDRKLLLRGVRMRVLGTQPTAPDPLVRYGRAPTELRPEYRESPDLRMKLVVVDRRVALFPVTATDLDRGYLEITEEAAVAELAALFDREWAAAERHPDSAMSQVSLSEREQDVVTLLVQGHTDSSVARALGISRRTVSTTVSDLMDKLGVTTRFQLGVALGARHLLPAPGAHLSRSGGEAR